MTKEVIIVATRKILAVVLLISALSAQSQVNVADSLSTDSIAKESQSPEAAFRSLLLGTIIIEP